MQLHGQTRVRLFHGESQPAARLHAGAQGLKHRLQMPHVDEHIGRQHQVNPLGALLQEIDQLQGVQAVINPQRTGFVQHGRRQVHPDQVLSTRTYQMATQTGATTQIQNSLKPLARGGGQLFQQHAVALVAQLAHQVRLKVVGVLVEQCLHISCRRIHHGLLRAQGGQVIAVQLRVGPQLHRPLVSRDRLRGLTHFALHMGQLAPGFGQPRVVRQGLLKGLQGLRQARLVRQTLAPAQTKFSPVGSQSTRLFMAMQGLRPVAQSHLRYAPGHPSIGQGGVGGKGLAQTHIGLHEAAQMHAAHTQVHQHRGPARCQLQSLLKQRCSRLKIVAFKLFDARQKGLASLFE